MTTRRGFLAGMLVAAVAPAIVRAGVLMPVKPAIVMPPVLYTGEVGLIESFRFIESVGPDHTIDALRYTTSRATATAQAATGLTVEMIRRMGHRLERQHIEEPMFIVHPTWADALRAEGVPVKPDPRRFAMKR